MRAVLVGLAAFAVGLGGGTGLGLLRRPTGHAPAAHPAATDSTSAPHPVPDTAAHPDSAAGTEAARPAPAPPPADSTAAGAGSEVPARPATPADRSPAEVAQAYDQVARILAGMKPAEAGKVLAHLSDTQIEGLIRQVSPRQAARLLSLIPPERAGALSRRLLDHPNPGRP